MKYVLIVIAFLLPGCAGSRDLARVTRTTESRDAITPAGQVVALKTTTSSSTTEQESSRSAPDGAAIAEQVIAAIKVAAPVIAPAASPAHDLADLVSAGASALTAGGIGYLAHKKRQQLKKPGNGGA
jgi:hypothetical protein